MIRIPSQGVLSYLFSGKACPDIGCRSKDLRWFTPHRGGNTNALYVNVRCNACGNGWREVFQLTHIEVSEFVPVRQLLVKGKQ
jgi:hypothetical protein